jgi:L-ascorbate metabolism protein UlaG (beta-lactamase superfamily)
MSAAQITYLGHATVLIELDGMRVLTDPVLVSRIGHIVRIGPEPAAEATAHIDLVLVSHAHHDHLDRRSLRQIAPSARVLCPEPAARPIASTGLSPEVLEPGEVERIGNLEVAATEAEHDGRRWPLFGGNRSIGFVVRGSRSVYFAGDTDLFEGMREIGPVDVALLPVAGWGPRLPAGHMGPDEAAEAAARIAPRIAIGIHWGTLRRMAMRSDEEPHGAPRRFIERLGELAPEVRGELLEPGASLDLA